LTNADIILAFLEKNPYPYCDDCLSELCGISPRQQVNQICNLRIKDKLVSQGDICHNCNRDKLTRQLKENAKPRKEKVLSKKEILPEQYNRSIEIGGYEFRFLQELRPKTGENGKFIVERPQDGSEYLGTREFHQYGNQDFCIIETVDDLPEGSFVYVLRDKNDVLYIGQSDNLKRRWGQNYKKISPSDPFKDPHDPRKHGKQTNCKVNANILKHYQAGKHVFLYAHAIEGKSKRLKLERELTLAKNPKWLNGYGDDDFFKEREKTITEEPPITINRKLDNTPSKIFDYGNANENQKRAIATTDGPVLITAGPGTGKTFTLVQRALYLIQEKGVKPEEIMMATFTEKAAKELITRISNTLLKKNILLNLNEMYIGTFHSICLRFIKENIEYSNIKKNYRTLDDFDQKYTIMRRMNDFRCIENFDLVVQEQAIWDKAETICKYVNNLSEELVDYAELKTDKHPHIRSLGEIMETYNAILDDENLMDFSRLQTEAYSLIKNNPVVLEKLQAKIKYLMIDEYQDTNYIQERLVFMLGQRTGNICVVGDDDQGLYRFRGATIRNILEFPQRFENGLCVQIPLEINYRSNSEIVGFYNDWMQNPGDFEWDNYRYEKMIVPKNGNVPGCPAVLKIGGSGDENKYHENVLAFINEMRNNGKVTDLNQIAFLFRSVKSPKAVKLAQYLEDKGVSVYSPRSDMFFERDEVKLVFGLLLFLFPNYIEKMQEKQFKFMDEELEKYFLHCIETVNELLVSDKEKYRDILSWVKSYGLRHQALDKSVDYAYAGLLYRMFEFEPLKTLLDTNISFSKVKDLRIPRNLALLSQIITKYEYLHRINVLTPNNIEEGTERFFNQYIRFLYKGGINEYEDDSEYAPSGCVSFLTIHQSKGMEFPVVMVGSLSSQTWDNHDELIDDVEKDYFQRPPFEPRERIKYFDFWRLYYTAFSRAQNLLVLISPETKGDPNKYFKLQFENAPSVFADNVRLSKLKLDTIKDVNIKDSYSFTTDINVYETCGMQYKFFNVLEFAPILIGSTLYGRLVHQTIEDIHKTALRGEKDTINEENITAWFETNYSSLSRAEHSYLAEPQLKAALKSILRYAQRHRDKWEAVVEAEVRVSLVKEDYIIDGKIDLIRSPEKNADDDVVEIIDFKSEKKPDSARETEKINRYKKQLQVYAYLVEQNTGKKVSKLHLYYTGEEHDIPTISFTPSKAEIKETIAEFDQTVRKIQNRDFEHKSTSDRICENCDFRFYCRR